MNFHNPFRSRTRRNTNKEPVPTPHQATPTPTQAVPLTEAKASDASQLQMSHLADALKTKGNDAFREGDFASAEELYTQAIQKYSRNPLIFTTVRMRD
jgi:STIP1 family protein 1